MRKRALIITSLGLLLGVAGAGLIQEGGPVRRPAQQSKWVPQESAKHLAPLKVQILRPESIPAYGDAETTLAGRITLTQSTSGEISYSWTLPEGVQVVEGELSDSFPGVNVGQTVEVKLVVTGFNKEKQKLIALQSSVEIGGIEMGGSAVLSSRPEDTWEAVAPQMQQAAEEHLGAEAFHGRRK